MNIRRLGIVVLLAACLVFVSQPAGAQDYSYARVVRLSLVDGSIQVLRPEAEVWEDALVNLPIRQGYTLSSAYGRGEIEFESGATARLAEHSLLEFTELALSDGSRLTRMLLQRGTATFYANLSRHDVFEVATPHVSIEVPDNARFRIDALDWGTTVSTLKGEVNVLSNAGSYRVKKGQTLTFNPGAADPVLLTRNREMDEWDRWVADRDETITTASANSTRYVNAPFRYGLADLSNYGGWFYDARYGNLWQPWSYGSGWSPYLHGRWVFIHGVGWTWVSFEPWGWLPYHYGRWVLTSRGWGWIPGGFWRWHPGLVAWVNFGNFVGWCPLGPHDRPGIRPRHPQGGAVIINTNTGATGGSPNTVTPVNPNSPPRFVDESPLPRRPRGFVDDRALETNLHIERNLESGETAATAPGAGAVMGARPQTAGENPAIVYDPNEHRFVNNPNVPARPERDSDRPAPAVGTPLRPPEDSGTTMGPRGREPRSETPASRPERAPQTGWTSRPDSNTPPPRTEPRSGPPRMETPRPQPQPRAETPRPSPPPRAETPRPSPAPRAESPRPSGGAGIGGAPRERPAPPPRTEAPRPRPPRD
jgi:hypothetical protein